MTAPPQAAFWRGRRVLLTGHTGFKGAWLAVVLARLGAEITGVSLEPEGEPNLFAAARVAELCHSHILDIRETAALTELLRRHRPEIVFHLAARALVSQGYAEPGESFSTNVMGTVSVLEALRSLDSVTAVVVATTDKVYRNNEWAYPYRETDPLGGTDPYSASKAAAELVAGAYAGAFLSERGVSVCTVRAGNVIGGGDWAADRLVPDAIRAWGAGRDVAIRHPKATRPWQHVLEPLNGYLTVARLGHTGELTEAALNFGPDPGAELSVEAFLELAREAFRPPAGIAVEAGQAKWPEAGRLALDISKAREAVGFRPRWTVREAVARTMDWYRRFHDGAEARTLCHGDIELFGALDAES